VPLASLADGDAYLITPGWLSSTSRPLVSSLVPDQPAARYQAFRAFADWPRVPIDRRRWDELVARVVRQRQSVSAASWANVARVALRAATLDAARTAADDASEPADAATLASWRQAF